MPISAARDNNRIPMIIGTLDSDGNTVIAIGVNATAHSLKVVNGTTGTSKPYVNAQRDANRIPALWAVSSADGTTPIPIYADSNGALLVSTT